MAKSKTPVELTLYGADDEVVKELRRAVIPWGILKKAVRLQSQINEEAVSEDDIDLISDLIIEIFGAENVTREELETGADVGDMLATLFAIVSRARGLIPNAPPPG